MELARFQELAESMSLSVEKSLFNKLSVYFELLTDWNQRVNLTAITERDDVFIKHFLDSLAALPYLPLGCSVVDVGTGAGFPGLVLKLARPDLRMTLMDSLNKRVRFLSETCDALEIQAECIHIRAEDAGRSPLYRDRFDVAVSRAVARLATLYEYTLPLVRPGGQLIAYKAHCEEELEESRRVPTMLGGQSASTKRFLLPPLDEVRTLIFVPKVAPTPKQYPRGKNRERNAPLK